MKPRRRSIDSGDVAEIRRLYFEKRWSISKIARKYDKHHSTILHHLDKSPLWKTTPVLLVEVEEVKKKKRKKKVVPNSYLDYLKKDLKRRGIDMTAKQYLRKILYYTSGDND